MPIEAILLWIISSYAFDLFKAIARRFWNGIKARSKNPYEE